MLVGTDQTNWIPYTFKSSFHFCTENTKVKRNSLESSDVDRLWLQIRENTLSQSGVLVTAILHTAIE